MTVRVFVDTNVLVYVYDDGEPDKQAVASRVFDRDDLTLAVSGQVLAEFYMTVTRKLTEPLDPDEARNAVMDLQDLHFVPNDARLVHAAMETAQEKQLVLWDALIVEAAVRAQCETLLSEDLNAGTTLRGVTIVNPFADLADLAD